MPNLYANLTFSLSSIPLLPIYFPISFFFSFSITSSIVSLLPLLFISQGGGWNLGVNGFYCHVLCLLLVISVQLFCWWIQACSSLLL